VYRKDDPLDNEKSKVWIIFSYDNPLCTVIP